MDLTTAILAGGLGTRLRHAVPDRPKVLAKIHGRPFLEYLLDQIAKAGFKRVALCTGYLGEQVEKAFGNSYGDLSILYSRELSPLGTGGALRLVLTLLESDPVLVMNGDSFCDIELRALWKWHCAHGGDATLTLARMTDTGRYGRVQVDPDGLILSFEEKINVEKPAWVNAGLYLLKRSLLLTIPPDRPVSLEREMFPTWINRGLYGYRNEGRFLDIGTPEAYAAAEQFFALDSSRSYFTTPIRHEPAGKGNRRVK